MAKRLKLCKVHLFPTLPNLRHYTTVLNATETFFCFDIMFIVASPPLPSARQHPSYGDCLEVNREYYQNSSVLDCVTQCSLSAAHLCEQFLYRSNRLGSSHWDPYT